MDLKDLYFSIAQVRYSLPDVRFVLDVDDKVFGRLYDDLKVLMSAIDDTILYADLCYELDLES